VDRYFEYLQAQYAGLFKCARCRDLSDHCLLCNLCSYTNRGYPDIAAQAVDFQLVLDNEVFTGLGTSCAVSVCLSLLPVPSALRRPFSGTQLTADVQTVAGIISLVNDFRITNNRPVLGFLNPWLYALGERPPGRYGLQDITTGSNPGCGTTGFRAIRGWDPVRPARLVSFIFDIG
jgi:tripeptidyl-peptidase-1